MIIPTAKIIHSRNFSSPPKSKSFLKYRDTNASAKPATMIKMDPKDRFALTNLSAPIKRAARIRDDKRTIKKKVTRRTATAL